MIDWKHKLLAFLHDPPSKVLDIPNHQEMAETLLRQAGFSDDEAEQFSHPADWAASAADRLPFPGVSASSLRCHFDGVRNCFRHPLGSGADHPLQFRFEGEFITADAAHETDQTVQPVLTDYGGIPDDAADPAGQRWRARFFAHWRLWPKHAVERDCRFGFLPADTRIPDHTIWTHMQVVSALAGCASETEPGAAPKPAFLKVQIGPVQDFIAAARSIRDLWSGSYLLSWLMAAGLKALSAEAGPDAVVFPNLRGQPLFDLHWRDDLWSQVRIGDKTVWESMGWEACDLLTPNLPNVFLAVVPADRAAELGLQVETAIKSEWQKIAAHVWEACQKAGLTADEPGISESDRRERFNRQIERFLSISWQATPWPNSLEEALKLADGFDPQMPVQVARQRVQAVVEMATQRMDKSHRDGRYYVGGDKGPKNQLNNVGLGWSVILAFNSWALDAVRQTRSFPANRPGGWETGVFSNKDALTGREEAVAGGEKWAEAAQKAGEFWAPLFKHDDWVGGPTLVKRVWHRAYLETVWNLDTTSKGFPMPNTRGIAMREPFTDCGDDETASEAPPSEKYFAVLALDGDEIGKWVSGEKTPPFMSQLADYTDGSGAERLGARKYFEKSEFGEFLKQQRPLSPGYHLQFSEALANFALLCARPIVEAFDGRLIYAGGDDVVALLPADAALACAKALRLAFRGSPKLKSLLQAQASQLRARHQAAQNSDPEALPPPYYQKLAAEGCLLDCAAEGFLRRLDCVDQQDRPIPFLVPGPAADCSVGIAIAHFKAPLQDVVRAAHAAEKRAKKTLGRSAVAITLFKRS
ncbi:MAG TPA: type III-B CRISPR-associated protein Cas10/Cmr2, partial [Candidatus Paceibacterota bacterium]|nr:type III-B CRISPR-associated protein Cas10/Cmr2 [Candidatus Paceibacterota bacterium]